jgi:hypothetical protein
MKKIYSFLEKDNVQEALWIVLGMAVIAAITILA